MNLASERLAVRRHTAVSIWEAQNDLQLSLARDAHLQSLHDREMEAQHRVLEQLAADHGALEREVARAERTGREVGRERERERRRRDERQRDRDREWVTQRLRMEEDRKRIQVELFRRMQRLQGLQRT